MKYTYSFDDDNNLTLCTIVDDAYCIKVTGKARCHPDDKNVQSAFTGQTIATHRAEVKYLKTYLRQVLIPQYKAINAIEDNMVKNTHKYNLASNEAHLIFRQKKALKNEIKLNKEYIKALEDFVHDYIEEKDAYHKLICEKRQDKIN